MIPKEQYGAVLEKLAIPTLDLVIFNTDKSKVLLGFRNNKPAKDEWYTPGGRILKNEKFSETIARIMTNELGQANLNLELRQAGFIEEIFDDSPFDNVSEHAINVYFTAISPQEFKASGDAQHNRLKWCFVEEISKSGHPFLKEKISQSLKLF